MFVSAVILAAGSSARMNGVNKQLLTLGGEPVILRSVRAFIWLKEIDEILVVCRREDWGVFGEILDGLPKVRVVPCGGETRQRSVENALSYLYPLCDMVAIHDGARPLVRPDDIRNTLNTAYKTGGAVLGVMSKDSVKLIENGVIVSSPERSGVFCAQTPQIFRLSDYRKALSVSGGLTVTDDAGLFEAAGLPVRAVVGHYDNIKLTTPEDIPAAEAMLLNQPEWEPDVEWADDI